MDDAEPVVLADVSEEEILAAIVPGFRRTPAQILGPGDDAAVVAAPGGSVVATTDSMVRGRDWLDEWSTPEDVAAKCLTQNLADIAAMGARPSSLLVSLIADDRTPLSWVRRFARALGDGAAAAGVAVVGGDLSSAPAGTLVVSVTALGDLVGEPVRRDGARPGDVLAIRGTLGRSGAGLRLLQAHGDAPPSQWLPGSGPGERELVHAHVAPPGAHGEGVVAARAGATAMIDVSDGLLRDLDRVARASGVVVDLDGTLLAVDHDALVTAGVPDDAAWEDVLTGGEEHALVAAFPGVDDVPHGWRVIGTVRPLDAEGPGVRLDGTRQSARGWDHFAG
jgi:thiamine-monophosphate kinase